MDGKTHSGGSATAQRGRKIKVAPMARAVRLGLAASVAALALGSSNAALAADWQAPAPRSISYSPVATDTAPVADLTTVRDGAHPTSASLLFTPLAIDESGPGDIIIDNADPISESGAYDVIAIRGYSVGGLVDITNQASGTLDTSSVYGNSIGIYGYSATADVEIDNSGAINAVSEYGLAEGIFASGVNVDVGNTAGITADGATWAAGIEAQGSDATTVYNNGDISAIADDSIADYYYGPITAGGKGFGIYATGGDGGVQVSTGVDSTIAVQGGYATGIEVAASGDIAVANGGSITSGTYGTQTGIGINAASASSDVLVAVTNSGDISAQGRYSGIGIAAAATGDGGTASVTNTGSIYAAQTTLFGYGAYGVLATAYGDVAIDNSGSITSASLSTANGVVAQTFQGNASVTNSGDINVNPTLGNGYGVVSFSQNGAAQADNSGSIAISAYASYAFGVGMDVSGAQGAVVSNSGDIAVEGWYGKGLNVRSSLGDVEVDNSGSIFVTYAGAPVVLMGVQATSGQGELHIDNSGEIHVQVLAASDRFPSDALAVYADSLGTILVENSGSITAESQHYSFGVLAFGANVDVENSGSIEVVGDAEAWGIDAGADDGDAHVVNSGDVSANSANGRATGIFGFSVTGDVTIENSGTVAATGYLLSNGVLADAYGDIVINNAGTGTISATNATSAAAIVMMSSTGTATVNNAGDIHVDAPLEGQVAVLGGAQQDIINNTGHIFGALVTNDGDDQLNNNSQGIWYVNNHATDFGAGDDIISNAAGGTVRLDNGAISLGSSVAGNAFNNAGMIKSLGDNLIDMGSGPDVALVPSLNPLALMNTGVIDFLDGATDDLLTIVGDLGGNGAINIDLSLLNQASDQLYVDGSMASGAVQTVNLTMQELPTIASTPVVFARVSGDSSAGSFVGGEVIGFSSKDFLDLGVVVTSQIDATNATADTFAAGIGVLGLNDTGTLAANVASGAAGMLNAQVGTFKQRMGVNPYGDAGKVLSAFFRTYTSEGDVEPAHVAANFDQNGNFGYDQSVWGREVGVNANLFGNVHAGLTVGTADGRQRLTGTGVGTNRMDGMTWGLYATWFAPQGFYVDVSGRWMAVDVVSTSAAGQNQTRAHTGAWNLEAGYQWTLGGLSVVPQLQYTRTEVEDVRAIHGERVDFEGHGGVSERGRIGVEISKTFQSGNVRWTPYGSINAVREFDGEMGYTVADDFTGSTSTKGTSSMAELGLGVQVGGWGFTLGANWTDGGAFKSAVGGQAIVRFAW